MNENSYLFIAAIQLDLLTIIPVQTEIKIHPCDSIQSDTSGITNNSNMVQMNVQLDSDNIIAETITKILPGDQINNDNIDIHKNSGMAQTIVLFESDSNIAKKDNHITKKTVISLLHKKTLS